MIKAIAFIRFSLVATFVCIGLSQNAWAIQYLKLPAIKEGANRQMVLQVENVPEAMDTVQDDKTHMKYEIDEVELSLGYNDGEKNKQSQIKMVKSEIGKWVGNVHRSMLYPAGTWFGSLFQVRVTLTYSAPDNSKMLVRSFVTQPGQLLLPLHTDATSVKPAALSLSLGDIDLQKD